MFEHMGVGAVGEMQSACGASKYIPMFLDDNLTVTCDNELATIKEILFIGVGLNDSTTC